MGRLTSLRWISTVPASQKVTTRPPARNPANGDETFRNTSETFLRVPNWYENFGIILTQKMKRGSPDFHLQHHASPDKGGHEEVVEA